MIPQLTEQSIWGLVSEPRPHPCRCALCHQPETLAARRSAERFEVSNTRESGEDLGALLLVKTSAVTNAWAHGQCLFWSPDVYVDGEGEDKHLAGKCTSGSCCELGCLPS